MGRLAVLKSEFQSKKRGYLETYTELFGKIEKRNPVLNAYLEVFKDDCLEKAKSLDSKSAAPQDLQGLPIAIKDVISIQGKELTASSKLLKSFKAPRSATVTERLESAGAFFTGRLNCDEFAMGSSNENSAYGPVKNPLHLEKTPGGSSGGSAAAVAGELCVGALGTDTGGSIRLPAAYCGLVGLRPTYGRVSRSGVIAFASSLDQVGPIAEDALDCAEILKAIAGRDPRDSTSMKVKVDDYPNLLANGSLKGLKIGFEEKYINSDSLESPIDKVTQDALESMKAEGAELVPIDLPHTKYGIAIYYVVATAEAASNLARYDGIRYGTRAKEYSSVADLIKESRSQGFGKEVKRRIMLGSFSLSSGYYDAYYSKAQFVRQKIQNEYLEALKKVDLIFSPMSPSPVFNLGDQSFAENPLKMYLMDIFTVAPNLAGIPSAAFPIGNDNDGLPISAQFIGGPFEEAKILSSIHAFEKVSAYKKGALAC